MQKSMRNKSSVFPLSLEGLETRKLLSTMTYDIKTNLPPGLDGNPNANNIGIASAVGIHNGVEVRKQAQVEPGNRAEMVKEVQDYPTGYYQFLYA